MQVKVLAEFLGRIERRRLKVWKQLWNLKELEMRGNGTSLLFLKL